MYVPVTFLTVSALLLGVGSNAMIVAPGVSVEFNNCTGPADEFFQPTWFVNGRVAATDGGCYRSILSGMDHYIATLVINGNHTCDTFNVYCRIYRESQALYLHNTTLTVQGRLPSPESIHINELINSSAIEWKPPYSSLNNETVHVDPHITQYTVYITDNYTGNIIVKENVTETQFTPNTSDDDSCPMYQVSAWNAAGEGEMSEPIQDSTPQVPHRIAAENIIVTYTNVLHIHIDVNNICTRRIPEFFFITVTSAGGVSKESNTSHDPGQEVADFTISLPQSVDACSLHVRIRAGNSAGMSAPSEAVEVGCPDGSTDSTITTGTEGVDNEQNEDLTTLIVFAALGGVVAVATIAAIAGIICCTVCRKYKRRKNKDQTQNYYSNSPSLGGPAPLYKLPVAEAVYDTTEQTTRRPVARDPEHTAIWMQTIDSAPSTLQTGSSTESGHSADLLLPPSHPAPAKGPQLVYAQHVKQTQVQPPAHNHPVQYAQIEHQD